MAPRPIPALADSGFCLYIIDIADGNVWRQSLDGVRRELVIACQALSNGKPNSVVQLSAARGTETEPSRLHLATVPFGNGWTVLEVTRAGPLIRAVHPQNPWLHYVKDGSRSGFRLETSMEWVPAGDHAHELITAFEALDLNGKATTLRLRHGTHDTREILGLFRSGHAVVFDNPDVLLWHVPSGSVRCVAKASDVELWPRNLNEPKRFPPFATLRTREGKYQWTMKSPYDFKPKPEYLVAKRRDPNQVVRERIPSAIKPPPEQVQNP